jgi:hypothetical protein
MSRSHRNLRSPGKPKLSKLIPMWKAILFGLLFFGVLYFAAGYMLGGDCAFCSDYLYRVFLG